MIYSCQRLTVFPLRTPIWQRFTKISCLRSYHRERTGSRSIPEVKPCRARIVLGWLTAGNTSCCRLFFHFLITPLNCFGCFRTRVLVCQASVKIKLSLLSVHCYTTFMLSSKYECLVSFPQCLLRTFQTKESKLKSEKNSKKRHIKPQTYER